MAIEDFHAVDATGCNIEGRTDGRSEEWACGGDFAWTDADAGVSCTETIFGHFVDAGALERAIIDTPPNCE
jgi:hypothetical protein